MQAIDETSNTARSAPTARSTAEKPISSTETALVVDRNAAARELVSEVIRRGLNFRVLEASGVVEGRYLAAVEGKIRLLLSTSSSNEDLEFVRWFLAMHPESKAIIAGDSLWELSGGGEEASPVLVAKSYTADELVLSLRRLLA
jgi:hypothetical protein